MLFVDTQTEPTRGGKYLWRACAQTPTRLVRCAMLVDTPELSDELLEKAERSVRDYQTRNQLETRP